MAESLARIDRGSPLAAASKTARAAARIASAGKTVVNLAGAKLKPEAKPSAS